MLETISIREAVEIAELHAKQKLEGCLEGRAQIFEDMYVDSVMFWIFYTHKDIEMTDKVKWRLYGWAFLVTKNGEHLLVKDNLGDEHKIELQMQELSKYILRVAKSVRPFLEKHGIEIGENLEKFHYG